MISTVWIVSFLYFLCVLCTCFCRFNFSAMSSSKRKLVVKSTSDDKSKLTVFDRLGPGISSRASESEVRCSN